MFQIGLLGRLWLFPEKNTFLRKDISDRIRFMFKTYQDKRNAWEWFERYIWFFADFPFHIDFIHFGSNHSADVKKKREDKTHEQFHARKHMLTLTDLD